MRVLNTKRKIVVVFTLNGNGCPRMIVGAARSVRFRDDYKHSVSLNKRLAKMLASA